MPTNVNDTSAHNAEAGTKAARKGVAVANAKMALARKTAVAAPTPPLGYSFSEAAKVAGPGNSRSKLYEAARAGLLRVKKSGRSSVILHEDLVAYLHSLPDADLSEAA